MHPTVIVEDGVTIPRYPKSSDVLEAAGTPSWSDRAKQRQKKFAMSVEAWPKDSLFRHSCESVVQAKWCSSVWGLARALLVTNLQTLAAASTPDDPSDSESCQSGDDDDEILQWL